MAEPAFDTLTIARELERDYSYEQKQAEGVSTIIYRHLVGKAYPFCSDRSVFQQNAVKKQSVSTKC